MEKLNKNLHHIDPDLQITDYDKDTQTYSFSLDFYES